MCGKWIKIKKVPEVVSEDDFVKGYFKESDLPTDVCATIQVVGGFELRADLFVGVGQGIVWKTVSLFRNNKFSMHCINPLTNK